MRWRMFNATIGQFGATSIDVPDAAIVMLPATRAGEELAGRLAVATGGNFVGRVSSMEIVDDEIVVRRAAFGGRIELETRHRSGRLFATCHEPIANAEELALAPPQELALDSVPVAAADAALEGARVVVSGGRGLDADDFRQLRNLAVRLGGAVGGSLPAVDLGLVPVARQIGQSGKFVTPEIYLAVGVSGTPQHLAGIGAATRIIAINKDPTAAIFRFAEAGAVGDAKEILPRLVAALSKENAHV